jgi:hypothetical protein
MIKIKHQNINHVWNMFFYSNDLPLYVELVSQLDHYIEAKLEQFSADPLLRFHHHL